MTKNNRLAHYDRLADRWFAIGVDWQARWFIYHLEYERTLERIARCIGACYEGCAAGRTSRYRTLDILKDQYKWLLSFYEDLVEDYRQSGLICAACNDLITPAWELPPGEKPCFCD
jgi:hypothetical protein